MYADYTASGRGLSFIEKFIEENVLDTYANTHSKGTINGIQTTKFRNEARYNFKNFIYSRFHNNFFSVIFFFLPTDFKCEFTKGFYSDVTIFFSRAGWALLGAKKQCFVKLSMPFDKVLA